MAENKANAEAKMAVVGALDDTSRALVHTLGYRGFKHFGPKPLTACERAKRRAGIGHTRRTQDAKVSARLRNAAAASARTSTKPGANHASLRIDAGLRRGAAHERAAPPRGQVSPLNADQERQARAPLEGERRPHLRSHANFRPYPPRVGACVSAGEEVRLEAAGGRPEPAQGANR
jgi:hypothetical protein